MRPIKFRGRVINRKAAVGNEAEIGDIVTGSLIVYEEDPARRRYWIKRQEKNHTHIDYPVDPDSIAQLVGYDSNGAEIYEGDTVADQLGIEYVARQITVFMNDEDCVALSDSGKLVFTLKKEETP